MTDRRRVWRLRLLKVAPGAGRPTRLTVATAPRLPPAPRIVAVRPDHLGDLLFTGPALARLRAAWPDARVTALVGPWGQAVAERLPGVDRVRTLEFPWFDRRPKGPPWAPYARLLRAARSLRREGYQLALVLRDDDWWGAWLAALAGIPVRAGHDRPGVRPFLTHALPASGAGRHAAAEALALAAAVTGRPGADAGPEVAPLTVRLTLADHRAAAALLAGVTGRPVAIHPGSGAAIKRWRSGAWAEAMAAVTTPDEVVVLTGGPAEAPLTAAVAALAPRPILDLAGRTDLGSLAAVFARCRLVLGPDSGPLHLAVAVGTPTVHLFGPADAARFGPWGPPDQHRVVASPLPCAPCGRLDWPNEADHPCVRLLAVAAVVAAARACDRPGRNL